MKTYLKIQGLLFVVALSLLTFSCGKDSSSGGGGGNAAVPATCGYGQVRHPVYGCLNQGYCPQGQGIYNNSCVAGTPSNGNSCQGYCPAGQIQTQYGCAAQSSCQACMGMVNNQCVPGYQTGNIGGGAYPYYGNGGANGYYNPTYGYGGYNTQYYYPYNNYRGGNWGPFYYYYGY